MKMLNQCLESMKMEIFIPEIIRRGFKNKNGNIGHKCIELYSMSAFGAICIILGAVNVSLKN